MSTTNQDFNLLAQLDENPIQVQETNAIQTNDQVQNRPMTPTQNLNPMAQLQAQLEAIKPSTAAAMNGDLNGLDQFLPEERPKTGDVQLPQAQSSLDVKKAIAQGIAKKLPGAQKKSAIQKSQEEIKNSITDLRNEFLLYLAKVYQNDTRKEGVLGCHRIIQRNCDNPAVLRIIIGALCDRSSQVANSEKKPHGLMFHAQMFGYVAKCFKTDLKDPLDKPPSLIKTIQRMRDGIYTFFKENSALVWRGCAISLQEILESCFPNRNEQVPGYSSLSNFFIDPLLAFMTGGSNTVQVQGASFCIKHLVDYFIAQQQADPTQSDMLEQVHQYIVQHTTVCSSQSQHIIQKYKVDNISQLGVVFSLLSALGPTVIQNHTEGIINLCVRVLSTQSNQAAHKKAACDLLAAIGDHLKSQAATAFPSYSKEVFKGLEAVSNEKQIDLQESRNRAKTVWLEMENTFNALDPIEKQQILGSLSKQLANKFNKLRDQAKEGKAQQRRTAKSQTPVKDPVLFGIEETQKLVAQDFLRKGKGQGGGVAKGSPRQSKDRKLFDDLSKIQQMNSVMKKGEDGKKGTVYSQSPDRDDQFKQDFMGLFRPQTGQKDFNGSNNFEFQNQRDLLQNHNAFPNYDPFSQAPYGQEQFYNNHGDLVNPTDGTLQQHYAQQMKNAMGQNLGMPVNQAYNSPLSQQLGGNFGNQMQVSQTLPVNLSSPVIQHKIRQLPLQEQEVIWQVAAAIPNFQQLPPQQQQQILNQAGISYLSQAALTNYNRAALGGKFNPVSLGGQDPFIDVSFRPSTVIGEGQINQKPQQHQTYNDPTTGQQFTYPGIDESQNNLGQALGNGFDPIQESAIQGQESFLKQPVQLGQINPTSSQQQIKQPFGEQLSAQYYQNPKIPGFQQMIDPSQQQKLYDSIDGSIGLMSNQQQENQNLGSLVQRTLASNIAQNANIQANGFQQQQQQQQPYDFMAASPDTKLRFLEEQRSNLRQQAHNMIQQNPQLQNLVSAGINPNQSVNGGNESMLGFSENGLNQNMVSNLGQVLPGFTNQISNGKIDQGNPFSQQIGASYGNNQQFLNEQTNILNGDSPIFATQLQQPIKSGFTSTLQNPQQDLNLHQQYLSDPTDIDAEYEIEFQAVEGTQAQNPMNMNNSNQRISQLAGSQATPSGIQEFQNNTGLNQSHQRPLPGGRNSQIGSLQQLQNSFQKQPVTGGLENQPDINQPNLQQLQNDSYFLQQYGLNQANNSLSPSVFADSLAVSYNKASPFQQLANQQITNPMLQPQVSFDPSIAQQNERLTQGLPKDINNSPLAHNGVANPQQQLHNKNTQAFTNDPNANVQRFTDSLNFPQQEFEAFGNADPIIGNQAFQQNHVQIPYSQKASPIQKQSLNPSNTALNYKLYQQNGLPQQKQQNPQKQGQLAQNIPQEILPFGGSHQPKTGIQTKNQQQKQQNINLGSQSQINAGRNMISGGAAGGLENNQNSIQQNTMHPGIQSQATNHRDRNELQNINLQEEKRNLVGPINNSGTHNNQQRQFSPNPLESHVRNDFKQPDQMKQQLQNSNNVLIQEEDPDIDKCDEDEDINDREQSIFKSQSNAFSQHIVKPPQTKIAAPALHNHKLHQLASALDSQVISTEQEKSQKASFTPQMVHPQVQQLSNQNMFQERQQQNIQIPSLQKPQQNQQFNLKTHQNPTLNQQPLQSALNQQQPLGNLQNQRPVNNQVQLQNPKGKLSSASQTQLQNQNKNQVSQQQLPNTVIPQESQQQIQQVPQQQNDAAQPQLGANPQTRNTPSIQTQQIPYNPNQIQRNTAVTPQQQQLQQNSLQQQSSNAQEQNQILRQPNVSLNGQQQIQQNQVPQQLADLKQSTPQQWLGGNQNNTQNGRLPGANSQPQLATNRQQNAPGQIPVGRLPPLYNGNQNLPNANILTNVGQQQPLQRLTVQELAQLQKQQPTQGQHNIQNNVPTMGQPASLPGVQQQVNAIQPVRPILQQQVFQPNPGQTQSNQVLQAQVNLQRLGMVYQETVNSQQQLPMLNQPSQFAQMRPQAHQQLMNFQGVQQTRLQSSNLSTNQLLSQQISQRELQSPGMQQQTGYLQPTQVQNNAGLQGNFAIAIQKQIEKMQQQMEKGFMMMVEKISTIDERVDEATQQLEMLEQQQKEGQTLLEQRDFQNQQQLKMLSDTLNSQSQPQPIQNARTQRNPHQQKQSKLTQTWTRVLDLVKRKHYEEAFHVTMRDADDMYLLRLVAQTGSIVKYLEDETAVQVINRINKIVRSGAFQAMEIDWIEDANRRGIFQNLTKYEQNEYLDTLFQFSQTKLNPKISERASDVYSQVKLSNANYQSTNHLQNLEEAPQRQSKAKRVQSAHPKNRI